MPTVGIDSIVFRRRGLGPMPFEAPMGLAITVLDEKDFKSTYDTVIDGLLKEYGFDRKKRIYKAAHLVHQLLDRSVPFIKDFVQNISHSISRMDIFYTYYKTQQTPRIYVFRDTHPRWYSPIRFIHLIQNTYPHICAWWYLRAHPDCVSYVLNVDYFEGKSTPAWESIRDNNLLRLYYSGSECNCYIATADIILRYIQDNLKGSLRRGSILNCLDPIRDDTRIQINFLGARKEFLNNMAPHVDVDANTRDRIKHPLFVMAWESLTGRNEERKALEWDNLYSKVMEKAYELDGCVKFWYHTDVHLIDENQDFIVKCNEEATPKVESIRRIFKNIRVLNEVGF